MLSTLATFIGVSALVICTPGQDTALTIRNTLAGGRRTGIETALGVAGGQLVWTFAASAGVVALLRASEPVFHTLKLLGAVYLVLLGGQSLLTAFRRRRPTRGNVNAQTSLDSGHGFRQGLVSNLGNPKMALFFATLLPQFAPGGGSSFLVLLALGTLFCSLTLFWLTLYATAVSQLEGLLRVRVRGAFDALTGVVLIALGVRLAREPS